MKKKDGAKVVRRQTPSFVNRIGLTKSQPQCYFSEKNTSLKYYKKITSVHRATAGPVPNAIASRPPPIAPPALPIADRVALRVVYHPPPPPPAATGIGGGGGGDGGKVGGCGGGSIGGGEDGGSG